MNPRRLPLYLTLLLIATALGACEDPVEDHWIAVDEVGGEYNTMLLNGAGEGDATLWYYPQGDPVLYSTSCDLEWTAEARGSYEVDLWRCMIDPQAILAGYTYALEFVMDCDLGRTGLSCTSDNGWYDMDWERE